jgi:predicted  nucleic acid-binding Zn-ribbon protein
MPAVRELLELQGIDVELAAGRRRLAQIAEVLADDQEVRALRAEAVRLTKAAEAVDGLQKERDEAIASLSARIEAAEAKLFGGTVTNPRELTDLQTDIAMLQRQRGEHEDALLEVLEEAEAAQKARRRAVGAYQKAKTEREGQTEALRTEQAALQATVAGQETARTACSERIPPAERGLYEQARKANGVRGAARMRNGTCENCRVGLPTRQAQEVRTSPNPVRCPSCGLILLDA